MLRVFTFLLVSFPKLTKLFYLCKCPPLLCFSLVLFLMLLGVGFMLSLVPFWGCLSLILRAFVCFIRSFEPSRVRSDKLFTYPLIELFNGRVNMVPFPHVALLVFALYSRRLFKPTRCFLCALGNLC